MKLIKCLGFFLLAVIVFVGFVYPFSAVPKKYESKAREMALARVENGSLAVRESYIEESVRDAVRDNIDLIFKTAFYVSCAVAVIIFCLSLRAPHDCGGLNWFNPIGLMFAAGISILVSLVVGLVLKGSSGEAGKEFLELVSRVTGGFAYEGDRLFFIIIVPAALEAVFRGFIFSYLEKIHFSVAVLLSTALYVAAAYLAVGSYMRWFGGSSSAALGAMLTACIIGFAESIIVWQLRSVIPAMLSHIFIAYTASRVSGYIAGEPMGIVPAIVLLAVVLVLFVFLFTFVGKRVRAFAPDFPLSKHHEKMGRRLASTGSVFAKKLEEAEEKIEKKVKKKTSDRKKKAKK